MKYTPCEYLVWHGLPVIRRAIAECMINDHGLSQRKTAKKLGVSAPAVSQYLSGRRGNMDISDKEIRKEINKSAERIILQGDEVLVSETCRLCKIFLSKKIFFIREEDNHEIIKTLNDNGV
jgi:predicted transcriptional regulator